MSQSTRQYEIVLFGATGFTGKFTAEHIVRYLPTDLRWAIAGRNAQKLSKIQDDLRKINNDRLPPAVETAELQAEDLERLARSTSCIITTVGPYAKYGAPVVEACAKAGTHYVDCTGEIPWVKAMIDKHHDTAHKNGAIIIPQAGIESAPADILTYLLAHHFRTKYSAGTASVINSLHALSGQASGGTLSSILTLFDEFSLKQVGDSVRPFALSPAGKPTGSSKAGPTMFETVTGVRNVPGLGVLTDSPQGAPDAAIVQRTWGLLSGLSSAYGNNFHFSEHMRASSTIAAVGWHFGLGIALASLLFPPLRWLLARLVTQPGFGPSEEKSKSHFIEYRAVGQADSEKGEKAMVRMRYEGDIYLLTGILIAEAAMVIVRGGQCPAKEIGGGVLTPATLGTDFVERLQKVGVTIEINDL